MALTVKKQKSAPQAAGAMPPEAPEGATIPAVGPPGFNPAEKTPSYTPYAVMGILGVLMFAGLIFVQWMEYQMYEEPGVFPVMVPQAAPVAEDAAPAAPEPAAPEEAAAGA